LRAGWPGYSPWPASTDAYEDPLDARFAAFAFELRSPRRSSSGTGTSRCLVWLTARASSAGAAFTLHVPVSDAPRRRRGHRHAGSRTGGRLARRSPCGARFALTRVTETALTPPLAGLHANDRDAFHRAAIDRVSPTAGATCAFWLECDRDFAHRSHLGTAALCVSTRAESSLASAVSARAALRPLDRHDARCVGPTSAFSRFSYEHPRLVGSRCVVTLSRLAHAGKSRLIHVSAIRFGGPHVISRPPWWALSSRHDACDPNL
jgi:hypothetical protein